MKPPALYSIPPGAPFAETLAKGLIARIGDDPLTLSSTIIYLPTRRAARGFGESFAKVLKGAALLPQFKALGESDAQAWLFEEALDVPGLAMTDLRRQLLLALLVRQWDKGRDGALSFAQCTGLAASLAAIMDEMQIKGCEFSRLRELAPAELAEHWQEVTRFLDLIADQWPAILAQEKTQDPVAQRIVGLRRLAEGLNASPPKGWVIAAGSTGSIAATAQLLGVIAHLPKGAVVLPGLDRELDEQSWADLGPSHPQFGLRHLLQSLNTDRRNVADWYGVQTNRARQKLLSETLRPAPTTHAWRALAADSSAIAAGLKGLSLLACADPAQEAVVIALALRQALEEQGRRAALVTPDRNLARRVCAEMARWNILIDDSAGKPLAHTPVGSFLCLLAEAVQAGFAPVPLLALLKHPFACGGRRRSEFRARVRELDRWCLRGPRPDAGLMPIGEAIAAVKTEARNQNLLQPLTRLADWWAEMTALFAPIEALFVQSQVTLEALLEGHMMAAQALCADQNQVSRLWSDADGEAAAEFCAGLKSAAQGLPPVAAHSYCALFCSLAMKVPVRQAFGGHPRLAILGPLEARLQSFDLTILAGLNEGTWPQAAGSDPWFSRPMREAMGLDLPERSIGLAAHDFVMLAAGPDVLLTRALKVDGVPTTASRWLQRLEQLTAGLKLDAALLPQTDYRVLAAQLMEVGPAQPIGRPNPRPPVESRPRQLSVTEIETWLRDPYAIYARHVLKLRPLEGLDQPLGALERGSLLHKVLELFIAGAKAGLPEDALAQLTATAETLFAEARIPKAVLALWRPRFAGAAKGFVAFERERRERLGASHLEIKGSLSLGAFTLTGIADRIDLYKDGTAAILDYKTGAIPTRKQVNQLLCPQLPLEAAILAKDGFGIGALATQELIYLSLADERQARDPCIFTDAQELAGKAAEQLARRIAFFQQPQTGYPPRLCPYRTDIAGDYDHLARVKEWSASGWTPEA